MGEIYMYTCVMISSLTNVKTMYLSVLLLPFLNKVPYGSVMRCVIQPSHKHTRTCNNPLARIPGIPPSRSTTHRSFPPLAVIEWAATTQFGPPTPIGERENMASCCYGSCPRVAKYGSSTLMGHQNVTPWLTFTVPGLLNFADFTTNFMPMVMPGLMYLGLSNSLGANFYYQHTSYRLS